MAGLRVTTSGQRVKYFTIWKPISERGYNMCSKCTFFSPTLYNYLK